MRADSLHVFYRLSEAAQRSLDGRPSLKYKPTHVNNRACLNNFIAVFGRVRLSVLGDRVCDATCEWLQDLPPSEGIIRTEHSNGAETFLHAVSPAIKLLNNIPVPL